MEVERRKENRGRKGNRVKRLGRGRTHPMHNYGGFFFSFPRGPVHFSSFQVPPESSAQL